MRRVLVKLRTAVTSVRLVGKPSAPDSQTIGRSPVMRALKRSGKNGCNPTPQGMGALAQLVMAMRIVSDVSSSVNTCSASNPQGQPAGSGLWVSVSRVCAGVVSATSHARCQPMPCSA